MRFDVIHFDTIDSTNTYLYKEAKNGLKEGTVVVANRQLSGKGRSGRTFESPDGNLYMSILIRPQINAEKLHLLTPMCAVCVRESIYEILNKHCSIKWVNDLYLDSKKVCGILTELCMNGNVVDFAVIGIGINVFPCDFDEELSKYAGSIFGENEYKSTDREQLLSELTNSILTKFDYYYSDFASASFMNGYRKYSMVIGREVSYETASADETVKVIDINDNGELVVLDSKGEVKNYYDGEIRIKL